MPEAGKKKIAISQTIEPFAETKTKKQPDWLAARPAALRGLASIPVQQTLELDPRKWKKKVIEDGVYAVARSELQLFATICSDYEKSIQKARPKDRQKMKFKAKDKDEAPDESKALDTAAADIVKEWKKRTKAIVDKVTQALEEIEADKGDNKQALKAGKEALKKFDELDTRGMFTRPTTEVVKALAVLAKDLDAGDGAATDAARKKAALALAAVQKQFAATAKQTKNIANYLQTKGAKIAKDAKADPSLRNIGKQITTNAKFKTAVARLNQTVDAFDRSLEKEVKTIAISKADSDAVKKRAKAFADAHKDKDKSVELAVKAVKVVGQQFNTAVKKLK